MKRPICKYCGKPVKKRDGAIQVGKDFFCDILCQEFNLAFEETTNRRILHEQAETEQTPETPKANPDVAP